MEVLHGLVDGIDLPKGPPRHTQLATQSLDHLTEYKQYIESTAVAGTVWVGGRARVRVWVHTEYEVLRKNKYQVYYHV